MKLFIPHMNFYRIIVALSSGLLISCGGQPEATGELGALHRKKDSLKVVKNLVAEQLTEIEKQIQLIDTGAASNIPLVSTEKITEKVFRHFFEIQGVVETEKNAELNADVSAKIISIEVAEGNAVQKGQILIRLDDRVLESNLSELKIQIDLAQTVYDKQKSLWDQNIGSEMAYLEAKNNLESLKKRMETLQSQIDLYVIKAPFDGIVDEIFPKIGELASPMSPLVRMVNLEQVYIKADVSESYLDKIKIGDTAIVEFPSLGHSFKTTISRIGNFINPNNRTFKVRLDFKNENRGLKPNLLAKIKIMDYSIMGAKVIPARVVMQNTSGEEFVFLMNTDGTTSVKKQMIKTGMAYSGEVEVKDGLAAGDELIVQGGSNIKDGDLVTVNNK